MSAPPAPPPSRWKQRGEDAGDIGAILEVCDLDPVAAGILARRGIGRDDAQAFLNPRPGDLHDPYLMADMTPAAQRLRLAISRGETILVHGDYDVDGLAATALLCRSLRLLGANPRPHIPDRLEEGYGLNDEAVAIALGIGASLVVSCDCGIRSVGVARALREHGIDLIITDHHEPGPELPEAVAALDPKRRDCRYPFRELAGVGVAFKLGQAVAGLLGQPASRFQSAYLDLVALGTIADVVPLTGENRSLAALGLERLRATKKVGLRSLLREAGLDDRPLTAYHVGYVLGPRLNAAGRIEHADLALRLLMTSSRDDADAIARELEGLNNERRTVEAAMLAAAYERLASAPSLLDDVCLVLDGAGWHRGVAGLVATRVRDRYGRPTIVLCVDGDQAVGSGRSIEGFDLAEAVDAARDCLSRGGGHAMAVGVTMPADLVPEFRRRVNAHARGVVEPSELAPVRMYDAELEPGQVTARLANELQRLAPFGSGNPEPVFMSRNALVEYCYTVGANAQHLKLGLALDSRTVPAVAFNAGARLAEVQPGMHVDVLHRLRTREHWGMVELELSVDDFRPARTDSE